MKRLFWLAPLAAALVAFTAQPAGAVVLSLGAGNTAISGYTGPYGSVTVSWVNSTTAQITYQSNVVGGNIYLFGDGGTVGLNFNGSVSIGSVTATNAGTGFTPGDPSGYTPDYGGGNQDGFGSFNFIIDSGDGFGSTADYITFTATNTSGTWTSDTDVLTANASGYMASTHVFVTGYSADASNGALATGFAGDGTVPPIPEPASMLLLGLGLMGTGVLGLARRRRK